MRWNTDFTGWARMAITLSWISRVSSSRSSRPTDTPAARLFGYREAKLAACAEAYDQTPSREANDFKVSGAAGARIGAGAPG